jgi:hypothetical protein
MITATETETSTECIHGENCPLHAENPPFNAKVLAAIEESKAIMRGDIPTKWYKYEENKISFAYTGTHSDYL